MRIPRDISGPDLVKALAPFGYAVRWQTGSHIRLTTQLAGEHHITIPNHKPLRIGTLNAVAADVAGHFKLTKYQVLQRLFG